MRRIIVTKTQVWEEVIPDIAVVEDIVDQLLAEDPDYEEVEVTENGVRA